MKKIIICSLITASILAVGCIKNDQVVFEENLVEFDAATFNANNAHTSPPDSIPFPILLRNPVGGRASNTGDASISRSSGSVVLRVNILGIPRKMPTEVNYRVVFPTEYKLIGFNSNPNQPAIEGTHYAALPLKVTIPADSSFGYINVTILNPGTASSTPRELVLMLTESPDVKISRNYKIAGIRISQ